jgi:AraC-like DNA-binding protein
MPTPRSRAQRRRDTEHRVMAVAIRAAIDAVPPRLTLDPDLDIDKLRTRDRHHVPLGDPYRGHDVSPDLAHSVDGRRAAPRSRDGASATLAVHGVLRGHAVAAVGVLRARIAEPWTLGLLAEEVHLSRSRLVRAFDASVGLSPMAYLRQLRAQQMARLLCCTDLSVAAVGRSVGWTDANYASRCFHTRSGISRLWLGHHPADGQPGVLHPHLP